MKRKRHPILKFIKKKYIKIIRRILSTLKYLTNNEYHPKDEIIFDSIFFIVNTLALVAGIVYFLVKGEGQWIPVLIIEYTWALDNMRHNRGF